MSNRVQRGIQKVKDRFKDEIQEFAKENAIYSPDDYKETDVAAFLNQYELEQIGAGLNSRVFKIKDKKWIVKEAKWDLSMKIFGDAKLPLPARLAQKVMGLFSFQFQPSKKNILEDYSAYLEFVQYFGYFDDEKDFPHPNINLMMLAQKNIRESLVFYKSAIERKYRIDLGKNKIDSILNSGLKRHNFLPKEYQLIGPSFSPENKGKVTSYIFQEYVPGTLLSEIPDSKLSRRTKEQLLLMIYLILLMHMQIGLLPDTKPRNFMVNAYNWLTHTDNIMVYKNNLVFIDTRWFWDTNANIVKKGVIIPGLVVNRAKQSINELLKQL